MTNKTYVVTGATGSHEDARRHMLGVGLSPSFVDAVTETARSFNEGTAWALEKRSAQNTTTTTLQQFAEDVFRKAYETAITGVH